MTTAVVYVTAATREDALAIARPLVDERLVACANVIGDVTSVYRWEGAVHADPEVVVVLKTRTELVDAVVARIRELHPYDQPCITSWPIERGDPGYLAWIESSTRPPTD